jgi:hypothetical protein
VAPFLLIKYPKVKGGVMSRGILNAREVACVTGLSVNKVYSLPHRQAVEGSDSVLFTMESAKAIAKNGLPKKAQTKSYTHSDGYATPFSGDDSFVFPD